MAKKTLGEKQFETYKDSADAVLMKAKRLNKSYKGSSPVNKAKMEKKREEIRNTCGRPKNGVISRESIGMLYCGSGMHFQQWTAPSKEHVYCRLVAYPMCPLQVNETDHILSFPGR